MTRTLPASASVAHPARATLPNRRSPRALAMVGSAMLLLAITPASAQAATTTSTARGCVITIADMTVANQIVVDKAKIQAVASKYLNNDMTIQSKINKCLSSCDTGGRTVLCIKNELQLVNGTTLNVPALINASAAISDATARNRFLNEYVACARTHNGAFKATTDCAQPFLTWLKARWGY